MKTNREVAEKLLGGLQDCIKVIKQGHRFTKYETFPVFLTAMEELEVQALAGLYVASLPDNKESTMGQMNTSALGRKWTDEDKT